MFPKRLRQARSEMKMTQEELATRVNTKKTTISNYETGYSTPSQDMLSDIANVLHKSTDWLLGRTDDSNPIGTSAPSWATAKDKRDIKKILEEDLPVMFDGKPVDDEDRQRITDLITGFLWDAKEKNKKTYGRKKNTKKDTSDDN